MATPSLSFGDIHVLHPEHYSHNGYPHDAWTQMRREDPVYWWDKTEGLPFFLSEVVNLMAEEGTLSAESVANIALPDGVREALGERAAGL